MGAQSDDWPSAQWVDSCVFVFDFKVKEWRSIQEEQENESEDEEIEIEKPK